MNKRTKILIAVGAALLLLSNSRRVIQSTQSSQGSPQTDGLLPPLEAATTPLDLGGVTGSFQGGYNPPVAPPQVQFSASAATAASVPQPPTQGYTYNESIGGASVHGLASIQDAWGYR